MGPFQICLETGPHNLNVRWSLYFSIDDHKLLERKSDGSMLACSDLFTLAVHIDITGSSTSETLRRVLYLS